MARTSAAPLPVTASVSIAAPPERVWEVVSDVTRMPEWSPELRRVLVLGDRTPRVGMRLLGLNRRGWVMWPTRSVVVRLEPTSALAWRTTESAATWTYELSPDGDGTTLTGRRDLAAYSRATAVMGPVIGGAAGHDRELAAGIRTTLERIKATVEGVVG